MVWVFCMFRFSLRRLLLVTTKVSTSATGIKKIMEIMRKSAPEKKANIDVKFCMITGLSLVNKYRIIIETFARVANILYIVMMEDVRYKMENVFKIYR